MSDRTSFEGWAIVELMGHRRLAGYVSEVEVAGSAMLRLDVPGPPASEEARCQEDYEESWLATQFYSSAALYCLTPTDEKTARAVAATAQPAPVQRWELPAAPEPERPLSALDDPEDEGSWE